ncbi:hypothetical protein [Rhodococcus artemisiae]|uniref:PH (Pleckstrin Homology) domain-containing protein n=1 Tax=Rhodococcus artemisiae TaxID=714159 RepID=A0ABU7LGR3_9NOCA|nr:hypothetical protein [Rhodococcus artemisiae]MEE2060748.1 hypothetical protein [Rhodococcus artemisiae]
MADLSHSESSLHLTFSGWEAFFVRRSDMSIPQSSIARVEVLPGWTSEVLGFRNGLAISGFLKVGTFTHPRGTKRLVVMKRGEPVLRIVLRGRQAGDEFDELLISAPNAQDIVGALQRVQKS